MKRGEEGRRERGVGREKEKEKREMLKAQRSYIERYTSNTNFQRTHRKKGRSTYYGW